MLSHVVCGMESCSRLSRPGRYHQQKYIRQTPGLQKTPSVCAEVKGTGGRDQLRMWNVGKGILEIMNGTNIGSKRLEAFHSPVGNCGWIRT